VRSAYEAMPQCKKDDVTCHQTKIIVRARLRSSGGRCYASSAHHLVTQHVRRSSRGGQLSSSYYRLATTPLHNAHYRRS
jgi:hypothetical protein